MPPHKPERRRLRRERSPKHIPGDPLGRALDEVNAWGLLTAQQEAQHRDITVFGPDVFRGFLPRAWVGVAIWYKQKGYYFYDRIRLLGIWAQRLDEGHIEILSGRRSLHYALPFFNAESYYYRIRREFRTVYKDDGRPPPTPVCPYTSPWDLAHRLDIRRELEDLLEQWALKPD